MKPESRRNELLTQRVGDELVIYDQQSHEAHRLSPTASLVWQEANGARSVTELSSKLRESIGRIALSAEPMSEEDGDALVRIALTELDRVGLLARGLPGVRESMTRREMMAVTAALLPVVTSIVAPTPAMAQTLPLPPPAIACAGRFASDFNGTYSGSGAPGTPNACGLGSSPVTITLNFLLGVPIGSMTITHVGSSPPSSSTVFNSPSVSGSLTEVGGACVLRVTGNGSSGPQSYQTTNQFDFRLGPPGSVTGAQQISYPECGTTRNNITATKQSQ